MAAVFLLPLLVIALTLPPRHKTATGAAPGTWRGVFHVHTVASDGGGTRDEVARAAADAGLQFVILTDHGDGTRAPAPPEYLHGVLVIDGVEIATRDGHYAAFGLDRSPYPLGGPAEGVIEDVARLGGFGAAAHPLSPREALRWRNDTAHVDGWEVLNGDSAWRDEGLVALARTIGAYLVRPAEALASLVERPAGALRWLDAANRGRRVVALAASDAHGRLPLSYDDEDADGGEEAGWSLPIPSYEQSFRAVVNLVAVGRPPSGEAAADAAALEDAIRAGRVTLAVAALAGPASLDFTARTDAGVTAAMGGRLLPAPIVFDARTADVRDGDDASLVRLRLMRDGEIVAQSDGPELSHRVEEAGSAGVWRVEAALAHRPDAPWLIGNPIVVVGRDWAGAGWPRPGFVESALELTGGDWRVEKHAASTAAVATAGDGVVFDYGLAGGAPAGQFAAAARDVESAGSWTHVVLRARAAEPTRLWVQLRGSADRQRWGRSIYLDRHSREVTLPLGDFAAFESGAAQRPAADEIRSVLVVVDTVNSAPGRTGQITIERLALERRQ